MHYLDGLNQQQKEAVLHTEGPLLIVAGAGAGKTRVVTHRILHLIQNGIPPESILAITFTNKAANEMRERVSALVLANPSFHQEVAPGSFTPLETKFLTGSAGREAPVLTGFTNRYTLQAKRSPWIGTFHSLGAQILRESSRLLGLPKHFTVFDRSDSIGAVREAVKEVGLDPKSFEPGKILSRISREKGNMIGLEDFLERAGANYFEKVVGSVWRAYEVILRQEKALDFDDLLLKTASLFKKERSVREHYQRQWRYIHIDEYQDTNEAQYVMAKLLAEEHKNIAVVGDIDQNIYSWRGANIRNILNFEKDYPRSKVIRLEENYRSTKTILTAANRIIEQNKMRKKKVLFTKNAGGEKIGLFTAYDESEEASFIALRSAKLIAEGVPPSEIAVLFRANFQSRALEEAFLREAVPYQVLGTRFFERKEVKDIIAYIRAAEMTVAPQDSSGQARISVAERGMIGGFADMKRIINVPPRGIGKVTLLKIFSGKEEGLSPVIRGKLASFRKLLHEFGRKLSALPLPEAIRWLISEAGVEKELKKGGDESGSRLENIQELVTFASRYTVLRERGSREEIVEKFLEDVALQSDQDMLKEEVEAVRLMTVHASKGLEFEYVFIAGLEQDLFPHTRLDEEGHSEERAEEERRLFYVALTRAKKKVFLSYASVRTIFGARQITLPSEFIFDIDEEFLEAEENPGSGEKIIQFE